MFDEVFGLPAHALIVHAAVVLVPLAALLSIAYAVLPRYRPYLAWAVVGLSIAAPGAVFAAQQSGEALKERRFSGDLPEAITSRIAEHEELAAPLLLATAGLGVAALLLVFAGARAGKVGGAALAAVTVVLALVAGFYAVRAGHTGAVAVWGS
jgi:hypothetical protein